MTEVFSVAIESFWYCAAIVDGVALGCGQGWEALHRNIEIMLRQGGATGAHQHA